MSKRVGNLTWPELESLAPSHIGLLPIGAGSKEHGEHLPLATDQLQVEWLSTKAAERHPVLIWPTVNYGHYPAFSDYPGSPSIPGDLFGQMLMHITGHMLYSGHAHVLIVNSGISTIPAVEQTCRTAVSAWHIYSGRHYRSVRAQLEQQSNGGHADELETSIMAFLAPHLVKLESARDESGKAFSRAN